jgi:hypothetical protein
MCAVLLAACGSSDKKDKPTTPAKQLDTSNVAKSIEDTISSERGLTATVTCPTGIEQKKGVKFVCQATVKKQGTTPFDVTVTDDNGAVDFAARG